MAIIKCPECGREVSDKAPVCPSCGVEIAGHIITCPKCGTVYFNDQSSCPTCHTPTHPETAQAQPSYQAEPVTSSSADEKPAKKNTKVIIYSFLFALVLVFGGIFVWYQAQGGKEEEAYTYAMTSEDPAVLQSYLTTYTNAPAEHRDSVSVRLERLQLSDAEWRDAAVSGSKEAMEAYLKAHPGSLHQQEALHRIDSIDWAIAQRLNTAEAYQSYADAHANGEHIDEATEAMKDAQSKTVMPQEKDAIVTLFRHFFQSINSKNEDGLKSTVAVFMDSFLGKTDASPSDVVTFMKKIYKDDITNMNWRLGNDFQIDKKPLDNDEYEYSVQFSVSQDITRTDASKEKHAKYLIKAKVDANHLISSFNMTKVLE